MIKNVNMLVLIPFNITFLMGSASRKEEDEREEKELGVRPCTYVQKILYKTNTNIYILNENTYEYVY